VKQYVWMVVGVPEGEENSALVRAEFVARYSDFRSMKRTLWKEWFRARVGRTDLSPAEKLVLWVLVDRWRLASWSVRDSITYLAKATGMHRNTVKRSVDRLMDKNIVIYTSENALRLPKAGERTHFLLVGLGFELRDNNGG
jgi:DNA-binding MarR family transcriptional regulator